MRSVVLLFNLLQDVNILRPLAYLAKREFGSRIVFLVSTNFLDRDKQRTWQREIARIAADVDAVSHVFASELDVYAVLQGGGGIVIAASESHLFAHVETHNALRVAPSSYLKVTLQHGYECVGFLHNKAHDAAHGRRITFAADVVCSWSAPEALTSLHHSERPKIFVTGPTTVLNGLFPGYPAPQAEGGLVCENLHSVRLKTKSDINTTFLDIFSDFCRRQGAYGIPVNLRPHPGGQYVLKNKVEMPPNVVVQNEPIYNVDIARFSYAISAPSTVLIDAVLAGVPAAVWQDPDASMDVENYVGLAEISSVEQWLAFVRDVAMRPEVVMDRQSRFVEDRKILVDRSEVYRRFATLIASAARLSAPVSTSAGDDAAVERLLAAPARKEAEADMRALLHGGAAEARVRAQDEPLAGLVETVRPHVLLFDADCEDVGDALEAARDLGAALVCRFAAAMLRPAEDGTVPSGPAVDDALGEADAVICATEGDRALARKLGCGARIIVTGAAPDRRIGPALQAARDEARLRFETRWPHAGKGALADRARPFGAR